MTERRTCVWPMVPGLDAEDALGNPTKTEVGVRAYMPLTHAINLEKQRKLQLMVGRRPEELYRMTAQAPEDLDSVPDEEVDVTPPPAPKSRRKRAYTRRDMKAET